MSKVKLPKNHYLVMLDFDGTLVPTASSPDAVTVSPNLLTLLNNINNSGNHVAIISGRRLNRLSHYFPGAQFLIIGHHGLQWPGELEPKAHPDLPNAFNELRQLKKTYPQMFIEDKTLGLAVHVRNLAEPDRQSVLNKASEILRPLCANGSLTLLWEDCLIELKLKNISKATAVQRLMKQYPDYFPIYIGNDQSDEEVFSILPEHALGIRVGDAKTNTLAKKLLASPDEVLLFLGQLV